MNDQLDRTLAKAAAEIRTAATRSAERMEAPSLRPRRRIRLAMAASTTAMLAVAIVLVLGSLSTESSVVRAVDATGVEVHEQADKSAASELTDVQFALVLPGWELAYDFVPSPGQPRELLYIAERVSDADGGPSVLISVGENPLELSLPDSKRIETLHAEAIDRVFVLFQLDELGFVAVSDAQESLPPVRVIIEEVTREDAVAILKSFR